MKYFGTDGIRGIFGKELTCDLAYRAGLAASRFFDGCFVCRDTRVSGEELSDALSRGLTAGGCNVFSLGVLPTPAISYLSGKHGMGGIVVSASHNPPEYNGLKFFAPTGYKLSQYVESGIEECMARLPPRVGGGTVSAYQGGKSEYIDFLCEGKRLEGRSVTLDCAFGAASSVAREAFERCGASVKLLCDSPDGSKINCGVGALYPGFVAENSGEFGFAFDGDADRLAVVRNGKVIDGDSVLYNLALYSNVRGAVGTVLANMALERQLARHGINFLRTAVGDKHISEAMRRHKFKLGGEQSGHYIISPVRSGDALFAALMLSGIDELTSLELVPQKAVSLPASEDALLTDSFKACKAECERRLKGKGRMVVRMSGTEPKVRIMAESEDVDLLDSVLSELTSALKDE